MGKGRLEHMSLVVEGIATGFDRQIRLDRPKTSAAFLLQKLGRF